VPRQPLPLIQDGVAHRVLHDTATAAKAAAASTGHASAAGGASAPRAEHLVLVGGGAAGVEELMAPLDRGLHIPAMQPRLVESGGKVQGRVQSGWLVEAGEPGRALEPFLVEIDPLELLAAAQALTSEQQVVPAWFDRSARTAGATVCPAARFGGGVRVR
jgi:predicted Zn-dependent protease